MRLDVRIILCLILHSVLMSSYFCFSFQNNELCVCKSRPIQGGGASARDPEKDGDKQRFEKIMEEKAEELYRLLIAWIFCKTCKDIFPCVITPRFTVHDNNLLEHPYAILKSFRQTLLLSLMQYCIQFVCLKILGKLSDITYREQSV